MQNQMFNPPPNYSGVTIQIANPAVNVGPQNPYTQNPQSIRISNGYMTSPEQCYCPEQTELQSNYNQHQNAQNGTAIAQNPSQMLPQAYPAQYYLNNYNYQNNGHDERNSNKTANDKINTANENIPDFINKDDINPENGTSYSNGIDTYKQFAEGISKENSDFTKSNDIINSLNERQAEIEESKKNTTETKIVALTDEYIKSLENYLDNPNDEIRLMASKEILTRLDEDHDRFDDAALNALLNKMMQDPSKLVRIAALSAFSSGLASGNDYTVKLLHNIQSNPNADKEDVLQAADVLLRMTSGTEIKNIPNPSIKDMSQN